MSEAARRRTVFLGVPMAVSVRDVLRSDAFRLLRSAPVDVHLFTLAHDDPEFRREFEGEGVFFHPLRRPDSGLLRAFDGVVLRLYVAILSLRCETVRIMVEPTLRRSVLARLFVGGLRLLGRRGTSALVRASRWLFARLAPDLYAEEFRRHDPDLVVGTRVLTMTTARGSEADRYLDRYLVVSGARHGAATMVLVASWDNLTSKGFLPCDVTRLAVWNEVMAREAVELHDLGRDQVRVTGAPQHDVYTGAPYRSRAELLGELGLDPGRPLVVYATQTEGTVPDEPEIVRAVFRALRARLGPRVQLLLRAHQLDRADRYAFLLEEEGTAVDHAGSRTLGGYADRDFDRPAIRMLADTLHHADVVLNVASSITIDAAAVGTPAVGIRFDAREGVPYARSVARYYDFTHQKNLVETGALAMARTPDEAAELVGRYLEDPEWLAEERARLVAQQCYRLDGQSGRRVGEAILAELGLAPTPPSTPPAPAVPASEKSSL